MKPKILIRTDGNPQMGLGHLVRCLALAHMLKDAFKITFYCKEIPDSMFAVLDASGFNCSKVENEAEFIIQINYDTIVVLDGYHFNKKYQKRIKTTGAKLVCIDDLHDKKFVADLIINHAPGITPQDYNSEFYTQFALGLDYTLLRPTFLEQAKIKRKIEKVKTVMICFGGSDFKNFTYNTLKVTLEFTQFIKIIVVTGTVYQQTDSFKQLVASDNRVDHRHALQEKQMLDTMLESEVVIVPSSGILFEALAAGCVAISGSYVNNQKFVYEHFKNKGFIVDAGNFSKKSLFSAITTVTVGSINPVHSIDGQSGIRISKLFDQLQKGNLLNLRKVNITDLDLTYTWATNSKIRLFSFQQHEITKEEHTQWFLKKLKDTNCYFLIAEYEEVFVGSIRFDLKEGETMISYLLDPAYHGLGLGQLILKKGIEWLMMANIKASKPINVLRGEVMKTNIPSIKVFERLGFVKKEHMGSLKFEKFLS